MLELLQEVRQHLFECEQILFEQDLHWENSVLHKIDQAIEDLKSISEPIGANIENVEVMDKKKKNTVWGMPVLAQFPPEED